MRIFLMEPDSAPSEVTRLALLQYDAEVISCNYAELISGQLGKTLPDIILLEILDNQNRLNQFKLIQRYIEVPIVVLSVQDESETALGYLKAGAQDYLIRGHPSHDSLWRCLQFAIERNRLNVAQRKSELRTRRVLEHAYDAFITLDSSMRITEWNKAAERTFGWTRVEMLGRSLSEILPPHMQRNFMRTIRSFFQNRENSFFRSAREIVGERRTGVTFPAEFGIFRIDTEYDSSNAFCAFVRDITQFKKSNADLELIVQERTHELVRSNEELYQFAKIASHDLQEPLRAVEGFVQLLTKTNAGKLDQDSVDFMNYITDGVRRMKELIQSILVHSRVTGPASLEQHTNCNLVVEQILVDLRSIIDETHASFDIDLLPDVNVEHSQVVQLFQNLIGNSLKYKSSSPPVISIAAKRAINQWVFSITDNGIGIEPEYRNIIFDMFSRLHSKGKFPGTGIGLAICKKIVTAHGGQIWVESSPGQGSIFMFTLPVPKKKRTKIMKDKINLLLVEDTPSDVRLCQEALKMSQLNYQLTVVSDGVEALEHLNSLKNSAIPELPDIILLDLNMPRKNGHAVLQELKADSILSAIPVILLTVSEREEDVLEALGTKMNYYLAKPITTEKIAFLIKAMYELHSDPDGTVLHSKEETHIRLVLASNPHTPVTALARLADDPFERVRTRVAENPRITLELQDKLAKDSHADVRISLCENSHLHASVLERLALDENADVRLAAAGNPAISKELLEKLILDENVYVCASAKKVLADKG